MLNHSKTIKGISANIIAYVHTGTFPSDSPSFTFVTYNALGMAEVFQQIILIVRKGSSESVSSIFRIHLGVDCPSNLTIIRLPRIIRSTNAFFFGMAFLRLLLMKSALSAVVTRNLGFLPYLVILKERFHIPVMFESHDFFTDLSLRDDKFTRIKMANSNLERKYIPRLSALLCLQNAQKDIYSVHYPLLPVYVLRTGLHAIHQSSIEQRRYLAYVGSFDKHKGLEAILKAASISTTKPDVIFIGAKNTSDIQSIQAIAERYGYQDKLSVNKWMTKNELYAILPQVKLGIVPAMDTFFNRFITSPLKIFDYYAFGIPVIASDLPTTRELIEPGKTGLFFTNGDSATFASHIDLLYQDEQLYSYMTQQVYSTAETLLWRNRAKQLLNILSEIV